MRCLTEKEYSIVQETLLGDEGEQLCMSVLDIAMGQEPRGGAEHISWLQDLGWYNDNGLTEIGQLISDPIREFGFWKDRDGLLPSEDRVPILNRNRFKNKRVLELGSGGGCNLLSLTNIPRQLTGLEPMPVYRQMTPILAKLAGLPEPEVLEGFAEQIPLENNSYDVVICYTSHQYMDIDLALTEMARVLDDNGELIIVGNTIYPFISETIINFFKNRELSTAKYNLISIVNTFYYQMFGKRLIKGRNGTTTATPIYPSRGYMLKQLKKIGLSWNKQETYTVDSGETVLVANS